MCTTLLVLSAYDILSDCDILHLHVDVLLDCDILILDCDILHLYVDLHQSYSIHVL